MTKSLRARLFVGLTAVILLAGCIGGAFTYLWAFDEAIEMQDSILIQIGSLLQNGGVKSDQSLRGVDADTEVDVVELGTTPRDPRNNNSGVSRMACMWCTRDDRCACCCGPDLMEAGLP
jgi:two-component system OmpR family sensor kinase